MCCGGDVQQPMGAARAAVERRGVEGVMAKVYATVDGAELRIGSYGTASRLPIRNDKGAIVRFEDTPVEVPDEVADELEEEIAGERPNPDWKEGADESVPRMLKIGSGPRKDIKVVRERKAAATSKAAKERK